MATLTAKLTLTNPTSATDTLNLTVSQTQVVTEPAVNVARVSVAHDAATTLLDSNNTTTTYIYMKNTDGTNHIKLKTGADELFGILWPGQFTFIPVLDAEGMKAQANNAACILEYGYWTKG